MTIGTAADRARAISLVSREYGGRYRTMMCITCSKCQEEHFRVMKLNMPEVAIARFYRGKGWEIDDKCDRAICPNCTSAGAKKSVTDISMEALRRQREVFDLLDKHFDVKAGRYDQGWSDAKISQETGLALTLVIKSREAAYGPILDDPEIAELRRELAEFKNKLEQDIADLREMMDTIQKAGAEQIEELGRRLAEATRRAA
jgi:hypothetical protein